MPGRGDSAVYLFGNVKLSWVVRFLYTEPDIAIGLQIANDIQGLFRVSGVVAGDEGTVFQIQVPLALEDEAAFAYYAAGHQQRLAVWHRLFEPHADVAGHSQSLRLGYVYRPPERFIQQGSDDPAMDAERIALVLWLGRHQAGYRAVLQLVKTAVKAKGAVDAANEAVAAVVVFLDYFFFKNCASKRSDRQIPHQAAQVFLNGCKHLGQIVI